jgi:hypothetical protein
VATATTALLTFFLRIATEELTTTSGFDTLRVQIRRSTGQITTLRTYSNLQAAPEYMKPSHKRRAAYADAVQLGQHWATGVD